MQGDNYAQLRDAVLGSQQQGSPTSPLGSFPELAKLYSSSFQLPLSNAATHAQAAQTDTTVSNQQAAEAEAKANALDAAKQKLQDIQDASDPSKFQQVATGDGGYKFYDGAGNEISAFQYAQAKNVSPTDVLKGSTNPIDIGFTQDYKQLQAYINAKANSKNDQTAADEAANIEAIVKKNYGIDLHKESISDVINQFKTAYPTVFGGTGKGVSTNQRFIPNINALPIGSGAGSIGQ